MSTVAEFNAARANRAGRKPAGGALARVEVGSLARVEVGSREHVEVGSDFHRTVEGIEGALSFDRMVFVRDGRIGTLVARDGARVWHTLSVAAARRIASEHAVFSKGTKDGGQRPICPPEDAVRATLDKGEWKLRRLRRIVSAPFLRADGSVCQADGYDKESFCFLDGAGFPSVPSAPSRADARTALAAMAQAFVDFPFASEADRYVPIAAVLTLVGREAIRGPVPLVMVNANVRGSGKSKLADAVATIATGRPAARLSLPSTDEEWSKTLLSVAMGRAPLALLDNIPDGAPFGSHILDGVLTSERYSGRLLGGNEMADVELSALFMATGNNPQYAGDLSRRVLPCRLESLHENPENRTDFQIPDLAAWLGQERPRLLVAALTLLSAYIRADKPASAKRWGGFEPWADLVAGAIVWAGGPDVQDTRATVDSLDESKNALETFLELVAPWGAVTAKDIISRACQTEEGRDSLLSFCPAGGGRQEPTSKSLGRRLHAVVRRPVGGRCLIEAGKNRMNTKLWKVETKETLQTPQTPNHWEQ